jgi:hypothetical protein
MNIKMNSRKPELLKYVGVFGLSVLFAACGGRVEKTLDLQGEYSSSAKTEASIKAKGIGCTQKKIEVAGISFDITETIYKSADCTGKPIGRIVTETQFKVGKRLPGETKARALDLNIRKVGIVPLSNTFGEILGADATGDCEIADAPIGKIVDVTGMDCGALGEFPDKGTIYAASFHITENYLYLSKAAGLSAQSAGTKDEPGKREAKATEKYKKK